MTRNRDLSLLARLDSREEEVQIERGANGVLRVVVADREYEVDWRSGGRAVRSLLIGGRQFETSVEEQESALGSATYRVDSNGRSERVSVMEPLARLAQVVGGSEGGAGSVVVDAYMPGRVVTLLVAEGDEVEAGQGVLVLEAMKMENEIAAERAGVVSRLLVDEGQAVEGGDPLFELRTD